MCTCKQVAWFVGWPVTAEEHLSDTGYILTVQCPVHGEGPDALSPTIPPEPEKEVTA